jgi:hypothetical protein
MAFPGTYNINYYMGDTYEFRVYPKDASGATFPLNQYTDADFVIATVRGADGEADRINAYAAISDDNSHVLCAIRPEDSIDLDPTATYVYDVQIARAAEGTEPYDYVYTILTGQITITDQVTPVADTDTGS